MIKPSACHRVVLLVLVSVLVSVMGGLQAHPLSISYSSFTLEDNRLVGEYRLPMDDMDLLLRLDRDLDMDIEDSELQAATVQVRDYLRQWSHIKLNGVEVTGDIGPIDVWRDNSGAPYLRARMIYSSPTLILKLEASVNVLAHLYSEHRNLAEFILDDERQEHVFFHGTTWSGTRQMQRSWESARDFLLLGIEHIFGGYDHVLFLLGLLLVAGGWRRLLLIVTSFTVAHSITLALSTLGLIQPSPRIIEIIVALSIAWVGFENLVAREFRYRWVLTFIFGLAHGFGFASVLQNMQLEREGLLLALLMFNLGVEVGQLVIVALFWPVLQQLARTRHRTAIVRAASVVIMLFGILWLVERISWL